MEIYLIHFMSEKELLFVQKVKICYSWNYMTKSLMENLKLQEKQLENSILFRNFHKVGISMEQDFELFRSCFHLKYIV